MILLMILLSLQNEVWVTDMPSASNRSFPMSGFRPSLTTTKSASSIRQPLLSTGVCIEPITGMGSFAKVEISRGCSCQPSCKR